jgi:phage gp16-like protein
MSRQLAGNRAAQIKMVHVACRSLGIDGETRRDLQMQVTGKASILDMSDTDLTLVIGALKERGFTPSGGAKPRRKAAARGDVRFCHVLWGKLHKAGAVDKAGAAGLNAFVRARFEGKWGAAPIDIDTLTDYRQIATVIEALKAMCTRAGITL